MPLSTTRRARTASQPARRRLAIQHLEDRAVPATGWAAVVGGTGWDDARGVATDAAGNIYVTGKNDGGTDFDPGPATDIPAAGGYVAKYDPDGNFLWVATPGFGIGYDLAVDGTSVYVAGDFLAKLSAADGARQPFGAGTINARRVALDAAGNVYAANTFAGTLDLDPGPGVTNRTSAGGNDLFVTKFDAAGNFLWARSGGGAQNEDVGGLAVGADGAAFLTGTLGGAATFGPTTLAPAAAGDGFLARVAANGTSFDWAVKSGGKDVAVGPDGGVYAVGPGGAARHDAATGTTGWTKSFADVQTGVARPPAAIAVAGGGVYLAGMFANSTSGTVDADPGAGEFVMNYQQQQSVYAEQASYVIRLDTSGNFVSSRQLVTNAFGLAVDPLERIVTVGRAGGPTVFDTGADYVARPASGSLEATVCVTTQDRGVVSGTLYTDFDRDGVRDPGEWGDQNWTVYLDANNNTLQDPSEASQMTGRLGDYSFTHLADGTYTVRRVLRTGWQEPAPGEQVRTITILGSSFAGGQDLGGYPVAAVPVPGEWAVPLAALHIEGGTKDLYTGLVWNAEEGGGVWSWTGATTWTADSTADGYTDWRLPTLAECQQAFDGFGEAPQMLQLSSPNWTSTAFDSSNYYRFDMQTGVTSVGPKRGAAIGSRTMVRDPATRIDDGATGYTDTGWASKKLTAANDGDYRVSGNGTQTATWTFGGLAAGAAYRVGVSWAALSGNSTNAPYEVWDGTPGAGGTLLATVGKNQRVAADDYSVSDHGWESLGTFRTTSGKLVVRLSNANGTVVADSARVFLAYPAAGAPLRAAGPATGNATTPLTQSALLPIVREAVRRWNLTDLTLAERKLLKTVHFNFADLDGATLGLAAGNTVTLDRDAAGHGWFVDPTPRSDAEFRRPGDQGEQQKIDLLTAVVHELGHVLGKEHGDGAMAETLATGTRETLVPAVRVSPPESAASVARPGWFLTSHHRRPRA